MWAIFDRKNIVEATKVSYINLNTFFWDENPHPCFLENILLTSAKKLRKPFFNYKYRWTGIW